jgi:hypothetical protein
MAKRRLGSGIAALAPQTALLALALLAPAATSGSDLRNGLGPALMLWAVVLAMALAVRSRPLILAALVGAGLCAVSLLVTNPLSQREIVAALLLVLTANVVLWIRGIFDGSLPRAKFSMGALVITTVVLYAAGFLVQFAVDRLRHTPQTFLARQTRVVHFGIYWIFAVYVGVILLPPSALPWVMVLLVAAFYNYAVLDYCIFTVIRHLLRTGELAWDSPKSESLKVSRATISTFVVVLFLVALVRYLRHCKRQSPKRTSVNDLAMSAAEEAAEVAIL